MTGHRVPPFWHFAHFRDLTPDELYSILRVRNAVFVVGQQCLYQDCDGVDRLSHHLWTKGTAAESEITAGIAAYLRIVPPGVKYDEPSLGRVLTNMTTRGIGLGRALMIEGIRRTEYLYPCRAIRIAAQQYLVRFYEGFGFRRTGYDFDEDGIPHAEMLRPAIPA